MKKFVAAAVSASMLMGMSGMTVFAEETGTVVDTQFYITDTAQDETIKAGVTAQILSDESASFGINVELPPSVMGTEEAFTFTLDDVVRTISNDLYINVDGILTAYQDITGDTSLISVTSMIGITEPWIKIPAIEFSASENADEPEVSEELMTDLLAIAAPLNIETTENGFSLSADGQQLVDVVKNCENFVETYADEISGITAAGFGAIDYKAALSDYITAAAEGINTVNPDVSIDEAVDMINSVIDDAIKEAEPSTLGLNLTMPGVTDDGEKQSEQLQKIIDEGGQINLNMLVEAPSADSVRFELNVDVADNGKTAAVNASVADGKILVKATEDGTEKEVVTGTYGIEGNSFKTDIQVPDEGMNCGFSVTVSTDAAVTVSEEEPSATALRDIVKNAVIIIYGMQQASQGSVEAETSAN